MLNYQRPEPCGKMLIQRKETSQTDAKLLRRHETSKETQKSRQVKFICTAPFITTSVDRSALQANIKQH